MQTNTEEKNKQTKTQIIKNPKTYKKKEIEKK